jgi:hypothetical protein
MNDLNIDPFFWFSERQLEIAPPHFTLAKTPLTEKSKLWVINNLKGRYSIVYPTADPFTNGIAILVHTIDSLYGSVAFEDPKEAILYELTWS